MLLLVLERAPPKLIGYCSSWALQVATGVYVANLPKGTRDEIWEQIERWSDWETKAVMVWGDPSTEQGLDFLMRGEPRRKIIRKEGLLVSTWFPQDLDF